jgi:hypothetical protein
VSQFFDRLTFFKKYVDRFSKGFGVVTDENRGLGDTYWQRWQHDSRGTQATSAFFTAALEKLVPLPSHTNLMREQFSPLQMQRPHPPSFGRSGCGPMSPGSVAVMVPVATVMTMVVAMMTMMTPPAYLRDTAFLRGLGFKGLRRPRTRRGLRRRHCHHAGDQHRCGRQNQR